MNRIKKTLSVVLALLIAFSAITLTASAQEVTRYQKGDIIEYGYYPQSEVTDEALIEKLNAQHFHFRDYSYWHYGAREDVDYSKFADVMLDGERYRAVEFSQYHHSFEFGPRDFEYSNKYKTNTRYWFKYEPLKWVVINPETGFVVCEKIIDYQEFNNSGWTYYGYTHGEKDLVANYAYSSIRHWLNEDFYQTAFSRSQKDNIKLSHVNHPCKEYDGTMYPGPTTDDYIFLLNYWDSADLVENVVNEAVSSNDATAYSMSQGLASKDGVHANKTQGWYTSTAVPSHDNYIHSIGCFGDGAVKSGIRPACILSNLRSDNSQIVASGRAGKEAFWSLDSDNVLSVGGNGEMGNMSDSDVKYALWDGARSDCGDYRDIIKKAYVENGITTINDHAFSNMPKLTEVCLPGTLISIDENDTQPYGPDCFSDSPCLEKITVDPENEQFFSFDGVFYAGSRSSDSVSLICYPASKTDTIYTVPKFVSQIGNHAFEGVRNLKTIIFPENVTHFSHQLFRCSTGIRDIYFYYRDSYVPSFDNELKGATIHGYKNSYIEEYAQSGNVAFMPFCEGIHYGGEATCSSRAICADCGAEYDDLLPHTDENNDNICDVCQGTVNSSPFAVIIAKIKAFFDNIRQFFEKLFK